MPKRNGAAIHIADFRIDIEIAHELVGDHGEGLVDLEEIDIRKVHAGLLADLTCRRTGLVEHKGRAPCGGRHGDDLGSWGQPRSLDIFLGRKQQASGAIHHSRTVSRVMDMVDREIGVSTGHELGECFSRCVDRQFHKLVKNRG